jgi:hypothetical protein
MARVSFTLQRPTGGSGLRSDTTRTLVDAAITASDATLTSATANFYAPDVGLQIIVIGAGPGGADLDTTIASVTSATEVELSDTAGTTVVDAVANIISDDVDGLRSDGLQVAPGSALSSDDLFFDATSTCYGEIDLEWALPLVQVVTASPAPTQYVVVYSPFGPPETIPSGAVVAEGSTDTEFRHSGLPEGEFAYYTLFVRYQSTGGDDYYERVAQISEIVPRNFGSTLDLWNRIPEYYREQDTTQGTLPGADLVNCLGFDNYGDKVGPLLTFLGIFGFEMDRVRSLAAHVARSKDPQHADEVSLDLLSKELGTIIDEDDLGAQRLRSLLNSIGVYRRRKGTEDGVEFAVKAVSGNDVVVDTDNYSLDVASGRVNYIVDPQNTKIEVDIETETVEDFGKAESGGYVDEDWPSSVRYPSSSILTLGQFAAATRGLDNVGTASLGVTTLTGMTQADGPQTYTGTADPDVVVPAGHSLIINDDISVGSNYASWSVGGTEFDLANQGGAITIGAVVSLTEATTAETRNMFRLGGTGTVDHLRITHFANGNVGPAFRTDTTTSTAVTTFDPSLNTLYYMVAHIASDWTTGYFRVYDSTGLIHDTSITMGAHVGVFEPSTIILGDHAGGSEMAHASVGVQALAAWDNAAVTANEWLNGTRTGDSQARVTLASPVDVEVGDVVSFSMHSSLNTNVMAWARLVDTATGNVVHAFTDISSIRDGVQYFDMPVTLAGTCDVEYLEVGDSDSDRTRYLLEKNSQGPYFDGSLVRGGWLIDSSSISDYRWQGTVHNSRSLYSEDYERTRQIMGEVYTAALPVTVDDFYGITYNNLT